MMKWTLLLTFFTATVHGWDFLPKSLNFVSSWLPEPCSKVDHVQLMRVKRELRNNLFGQHLVVDNLFPVLYNHFQGDPKKALVISMHGWTGSGKNHVANMVAESLFARGMHSRFVHFFSGRMHFPLTSPEAVEQYAIDLQRWVIGNLSECPHSMFIFDEVDKVPSGVTDSLKPFFDYNPIINSVSVNHAIFMFLSNTGGNTIVTKYMELWRRGIPREEMEYVYFESVLRKFLYNSEGGFEKSSVISGHLITLYLPFLPMERKHVSQCIEAEMKKRNLPPSETDVALILNEMEFFDGQFSISGCKRVSDRVALLVYGKKFEL